MSYAPTTPQDQSNYYPQSSSAFRASPIAAPFSSATPPPPPPKQPATHATSASQSALPPRTSSRHSWQQHSGVEQQSFSAYDAHSFTSSYSQSQQHQYHPQQPQAPPLPEEGWVPTSLLDKTKTDLETLVHNPALLTSLLYSPQTIHPSLAHSHQTLEASLNRNAQLAAHLSSLAEQLAAQRSAASTQLLSVRALEQAWKVKQGELERALETFGPRVLHQRLVASIADQEGVCKGIEDSFLEAGEGQAAEREVADWMRRVREGRRVVALRRERRGRWDEGRVGGWR